MYLLIEVAGYIQAWPTIFLVMLTAIIGVALLKRQGLATLTRGMGRLEAGEVPAREMAEGILLAVAGALLVTPGFITDFVGFTLLFPPTRMAIASQILKRVQIHAMGASSANATSAGSTSPGSTKAPPEFPDSADPGASRGPVTLEGDFERKP